MPNSLRMQASSSAHLILISKGKHNEFMTRYNRLLNSPVN
jgi:hypothetical protein